jgi:PAS domain S-box-containing protein
MKEKKTQTSDLRRKAENLLKKKLKSDKINYSEADLHKLIYELEVHKIELELQNEELRNSISNEQTAVDEYVELYDFAPSGYVTLSGKGIIQKINHTCSKYIGKPRSKLIHTDFSLYVTPVSFKVFKEFLKSIFGGKANTSCEISLRSNESPNLYIHIEGVLSEDGKYCLATLTNITERKLSEKARLESEQHLINLANSGQALIWTAGTDKKCNYFNKVWLDFTGRTFEQEFDDGWTEGVHPDDFNRCKEIYIKSFDRQVKFSMDYRLRRFDGVYRWIQDDGNPLYNNEGKFIGYIGHCLDITDKKATEEALKKSENKYRQLFQNMAQGAVYQDSNGLITDANPAAEKMLGLTFNQMIGKSPTSPEWKIIHEDGTPFPVSKHPAMIALKTGKQQSAVMGILNPKTDKTMWINVTAIPQKREGDKMPHQVFVTFNDISVHLELRKAQSALNKEIKKRSAELEKIVDEKSLELRQLLGLNTAIVDSVGLIVISTDEKGIIKSFNPEAEKLLGYKAEEVIGKFTPEDIHDKNELKAKAKELSEILGRKIKPGFEVFKILSDQEKFATDEWIYIRKDGSTLNTILKINILEDSEGKTIGYVGVALDITQRKLLEETLKQSEERFQTMFQNHEAVMLLVNPETGIIVEANKSAEKYYGYDFIVPNKYKLSDINVMSKDELNKEMKKAVKGKQNYFVFPHRLSTGEIRTVEVHSSPIAVNGQNLLFSVIHDITDRKKAEEKLEKSEALYKSILEESPDDITISDMEGNITMVSASALKMFGHENLDSMVGTHVLEFLAPDEREKANKVIESKHKGLITGPSEYKALRNDRSIFDIEANVEFIRDAKGEPTNMIFIIRDITDRKKIESELLWNETLMRLMANSSPLGFLVVDNRTDEILYFNHRFCELWGITHLEERMRLGELKNNDIIPDCLHVLEDIPAFAESCKPLQDEENRVVLEDEIPFSLGRSVKRFTTQIRGDSDEYYGRFYIFEDITERKRTEVRLKMQSAAFESFALAVTITDRNAITEWVNPAFTKLTGFTPEDAIGRNANIVKSGKQDKEYYERLWKTILSGKVWRSELINKRKDGSLYFEEETITPVLDQSGNIVNFIAIKIDITHRKEMENALRQSEERWQFALEGSGDGVWDWDAKTNTVFYSPQLKKMLGYDNKWNNNTDDWINRIHPDDKDKCLEDLAKHYRGETEIYLNEHRLKSRNGNYKWILDRGKVVEWLEKGKPLRVIGTHTDITDIKKLEESLRANIEKEKDLNDLKSRFVSTTSHEFRTPLSSILLGSDALISYWKNLDETQIQTRLQRIKDQALHMTDLVNEVMNLSKIQEGKIEFYPEKVDIVELCNNALEDFNSNSDDKIEFECQMKSLILNLDRRLMNQLINNLISNAVKYSTAKPVIKVHLKIVGKKMELSISDKGIGIPKEDQKNLFTAFFRANNAKLIQGNGLGLNIIKESLKLHGGDISFKSTEGKGSTFTVRIPVNN